MAIVACEHCGDLFDRRSKEKYCSISCAVWAKVDVRDSGACWPFVGRMDSYGYGNPKYKGANHLAHRVVAIEAHGGDPSLCVLHSCDNPSCCNPAHLRFGTQKDNGEDKAKRGRSRTGDVSGEKHWNARLTKNNVDEIRGLAKIGVKTADISRQFGVTKNHVRDIVNGRVWKIRGMPLVELANHLQNRHDQALVNALTKEKG